MTLKSTWYGGSLHACGKLEDVKPLRGLLLSLDSAPLLYFKERSPRRGTYIYARKVAFRAFSQRQWLPIPIASQTFK